MPLTLHFDIRHSFFSRAAVCATLLMALGAVSVSANAQIQEYLPVTPGAMKLELRLDGGRVQFHMGEVIPVELIYSSPEHREYDAFEDCTPRMTYRFEAVPPSFFDRSHELDAALMMDLGTGCHGGSQKVDPGASPFVIQQVLNDWFRMDTPGKYQISVTSGRLGFAMTSNSVGLEILPSDSAWEEAELKRAISLIGFAQGAGTPRGAEGCRILRFLETEASEVEMARHEVGPSRCNYDAPLVNVDHRKPVLAELEKGLADPDVGIDWNYIRAMAFLSLYEQHPNWYPARDRKSDPSQPSQNSILWTQSVAISTEEIRYARQLAASPGTKTPYDRTTSLETLIYMGRTLNGMDVPQDIIDAVLKQMPATFSRLSGYARDFILLNEWDLYEGPVMASVLDSAINGERWLGTNGIALRRLYELSPDLGRLAILNLLKAPNTLQLVAPSGFGLDRQELIETLGLLPEKEIPSLDAIGFQRLQSSKNDVALELSAGLLQRYASPAVADQLRPWFAERIGKISCNAEANLVAYVLRIDPTVGSEMLAKMLDANVAGCSPLQRSARVHMLPEIEQAAYAALDSSRAATVVDALNTLQGYGPAPAKEIILQHFREWHATWSPRVAELDTPAGKEQIKIESAYVWALGAAQGWNLSEQDWQLIDGLCVTNSCKATARGAKTPWNFPASTSMIEIAEPALQGFPGRNDFSYSIRPGNPGPGTIERLKEKMKQFPKGHIFQVDARFRETHVIRVFYNDLKPWATEHGYDLQLLYQ